MGCAMTTVPDAAIEAAVPAFRQAFWTDGTNDHDLARAAIEAAMPAIREHIAQEFTSAELVSTENGWLAATFMAERDDLQARLDRIEADLRQRIAQEIDERALDSHESVWWNVGMGDAARIVRGG